LPAALGVWAMAYVALYGFGWNDYATEVVFEMAAYIFSGDHAYIGLRRKEAAGWLSAYFRHYRGDARALGSIRRAS